MVYPFLAAFARGLGVDITLLSYTLTARAVTGTFGPFAAILADKRGRKFGILFGVGMFTLGAALVALWPSFPAFVAALLLTTLGKYIFDPSLIAWLGDRVPYERRGRVLAVTEFGWSLAFILGVPLVGFLIARRGWNSPFQMFAILGIIIFITLSLLLPKDAPPLESGSLSLSLPSSPSSFRLALAAPHVLAGLALGLCMSAANETVNLIFGVWLEDAFGLQIAALGAASAVIGLSELGGEGLVAAFVDRLGKPRAVALGLVVNSLAALALPAAGRTEVGALIGLFFFYISFEFTLVSSIPLMSELLPSARATVMALNVAALSLGRALGALTGPQFYRLDFPAVALGAVLFNLLALLALRKLRQNW
jgi:MFS transporter, DHA1 family, inner membrane transport protein